MVLDTATVVDQYKVVYMIYRSAAFGAMFNDLARISKSRQYLTLNVALTVQHRLI